MLFPCARLKGRFSRLAHCVKNHGSGRLWLITKILWYVVRSPYTDTLCLTKVRRQNYFECRGGVCMQCWSCNTRLDLPTGVLSRSASCTACAAYLRCCRMCRFYDPHAANQCLEPLAQEVSRKDESNFCDYFALEKSAKGSQDEVLTNPAAHKAKQDLARVFGAFDQKEEGKTHTK